MLCGAILVTCESVRLREFCVVRLNGDFHDPFFRNLNVSDDWV